MVNMAELCEQNRGLVYMIAKRYTFTCMQDRAADLEDLAQAGYIGLIEAARTFDASRGSFANWAVMYIRNEMRALLGLNRRDPRSDKGAVSLDTQIMEGEDITLADTFAAPDDIVCASEQVELVKAVRDAVDALPDDQREIVRLHDLQGHSLAVAGRVCGMEPSAASKTYQKACDRLFRNPSLRALAEAHHLDQITNWHRHMGLENYQRTWMSATEALVFWREEQRVRMACVSTGKDALDAISDQ